MNASWPNSAARPKKTVALTIAIRCVVAVFQSGVPRVIWSQSASPVSAVGIVVIRPASSAKYHTCAPTAFVIPRTSVSAASVASV